MGLKKKSRKALDDDAKAIVPDPDRSWENIFLTDDPDHELESEAVSFRNWMDRELSAVRPFAIVDRVHHHSDRGKTMSGRRKERPGKGTWDSAPVIDLHGLTREQALNACSVFLTDSSRDHVKWVKIIVGKGHHSEGGQAVLRDAIESYLIHLKKCKQAIDWFWEQKEKSKSGALLVQLL